MPKKLTRSKLIKKLDTIFSRWVRLSNSVNEICTCVTCGKESHWKDIQAGHFISRKHYSTRWDERNVFPQCVGCNVFKYGEQYKFSLFLGLELSKELSLQSNEIRKFSSNELEDMIEKYTERFNKLV
jgi:hypothetical protein